MVLYISSCSIHMSHTPISHRSAGLSNMQLQYVTFSLQHLQHWETQHMDHGAGQQERRVSIAGEKVFRKIYNYVWKA
jgi:hypothetical protein